MSPYKLLVSRWVAEVLPPPLPFPLIGLEIGGAKHRGAWRPEPRSRWAVVDPHPQPGVLIDWTCRVEDLPASNDAWYDVVVAVDVLHLVDEIAWARGVCRRCVKPGGRFFYTQTALRPAYQDADRGPMPRVEHGTVTPIGDLTTLLAQLVWERFTWTRPVVSRMMRHYRPRPVNPDFPPYCLAWGVVENR